MDARVTDSSKVGCPAEENRTDESCRLDMIPLHGVHYPRCPRTSCCLEVYARLRRTTSARYWCLQDHDDAGIIEPQGRRDSKHNKTCVGALSLDSILESTKHCFAIETPVICLPTRHPSVPPSLPRYCIDEYRMTNKLGFLSTIVIEWWNKRIIHQTTSRRWRRSSVNSCLVTI